MYGIIFLLILGSTSFVSSDDLDRSTNTCKCGISIYGLDSCNGVSNRIVSGKAARTNEFPWQAHVDICFHEKCHTCGGTVIDYRWVLIASHCVVNRHLQTWIASPSAIKVKLGEHNTQTSSESFYYQTLGVEKVITHPNFSFRTVDNDIALLKLSKSATFSRGVRPACLPSSRSSDYTGRGAVATGWGYGHEESVVLNDVLQKTNLRILRNSHRYCVNGGQVGGPPPIFKLCAYGMGTDTCQGDSGGPLVTVDQGRCTVVGVVSYGVGCARKGHAGVYARVSQFIDWIRENTKDGGFCLHPRSNNNNSGSSSSSSSSSSSRKYCDMTCYVKKTGFYRFNNILSRCLRGYCYAIDRRISLCQRFNYPCSRVNFPK